jgi:hypothetical protein
LTLVFGLRDACALKGSVKDRTPAGARELSRRASVLWFWLGLGIRLWV